MVSPLPTPPPPRSECQWSLKKEMVRQLKFPQLISRLKISSVSQNRPRGLNLTIIILRIRELKKFNYYKINYLIIIIVI